MVGQGATVTLELPDGRPVHPRARHALRPGRHATKDFTTYFAELRPWLWLLTLTRDSRIFQNLTVPEILEAIFKRPRPERLPKDAEGHVRAARLLRAVPGDATSTSSRG